MAFLKNALMCMSRKRKKRDTLINHDCVPILMLLYIMLAYLMLLAVFSNAACLHNAFSNELCKCSLFSCFVLVY